ncbi:MAG: hypothetical protein FWD64_09885 [Acidobacteriaceae bacterium]|nr:hypothetical protein [Acidobacteriaceae bacterium]
MNWKIVSTPARCIEVTTVVAIVAVLSCLLSISLKAQSCTQIRIEVNGKTVPLPTEVALARTGQAKTISVPVTDGCIQLPKQLRKSNSIDMTFQADGKNVRLIGLLQSYFDKTWTIALDGPASGGSCAVSIDQGAMGMKDTSCWTPIK